MLVTKIEPGVTMHLAPLLLFLTTSTPPPTLAASLVVAIIKRAMKAYSRNNGMQDVIRGLDAKQLAIKLLSNVVYGYTSATFSGRCCCPVLADAIVELGRRTLAGAMEEAEAMARDGWSGATVVYGDTDSVFVRLPGRSAEEGWR